MSTGPECTTVESPFVEQLIRMGWKAVTGSLDHSSVTGRDTFREVLIKQDLRKTIARINLRDGKPWLDDARISQAVSALERIAAPKLIEANQEATELLLKGISVEGLADWDQGRTQTLHYIDWERWENNTFTVMNQFRVDCPGGMAKGFIVPDLVLFVNGVPLVVVECKSPGVAEPLPQAVDQLRRYSNQRKAAGEIEDNEGNQKLFHTNQFLVATSFDEARVGTIGADMQHYLEWKDTAPVPLAEVATELGVGGPGALSSQQKLIAGMLRPEHLLDIIRHFTLFQPADGRIIKVVCRYQQFRAVQAAVKRLLTGKTREQDGEHDRRGGLVWHTQGSGKSLTMMFLVRKMRSLPALRRFKVVLVTDRKDLQKQLSDTAGLTGETVKVAKSVEKVKQHLAEKGPGLVFATIQKYAERDAADDGEGDESSNIDPGTFPVLNEDESILVMVDEAHRSHTSALHGNLLKALPNCARIGFTGTPIIMGDKKKTHDIFGEFIDRYTIKESEGDGATVPILYEGRTAEGAVADGGDLDQLFEDLFSDRTPEELEAIKRKYAATGQVLEAPRLIEAKARDILRHYVENILPNGLKAQVVAHSRLAAIRYTAALAEGRDALVAEAEALEPKVRDLDDAALDAKPRKVRAAVRAWRSLTMLKQLEFATVISGSNNDDPAWKEWTDSTKAETRIARFKKPLGEPTEKTDPLAFLVVKSMLLTGFDAPVEGVMYLDRAIREAELLQAIARVNRTGHAKKAGIIVDYHGVARHLKEALAAYAAEDVEGALRSLKDELPKLRDQHLRVTGLFVTRGVEDLEDSEPAVQLLADERLRAEFSVKLKQFLDTLDLVLPRPEGLPYVKDAKRLSFIYTRARNRYRDGAPVLGVSVGAKVRKLIDDHIVSLGVDPKIPPISITDAKFADHVARQVSPRAKASEMEHAARHHIRQHRDEDPVFYGKLSERLEEILTRYGENWEQLAMALSAFVGEVEQGRKADDSGLDPETEAPFFALLREERQKHQPVSASDAKALAGLTVELVGTIRTEIGVVGFLKNPHAQEVLRGAIFTFLDDHEIVPFESADAVADQLLELAKANHARLVKA
ncbi:MAG: type I restriction endonuclease subunit R [Anaeromyxobacteraceae bacterium]